MSTDPPPPETSETPAPVWPPAPTGLSPPVAAPTRRRTLTASTWLDLVLGLPTGLAGALLLYVAVGVLGNLAFPPPSGGMVQVSTELCVFAALAAALCLLTVRRLPFFGGSLMLGALLVLMFACLVVWI